MDVKITIGGVDLMKTEINHERQRLLDVVPLSAPYTIYLDPCGYCNLKCRFCPCNNSDYKIEQRHQIMDFELFRKIAEDLKEFDGLIKVINLYGHGEPLLHKKYIDMVRLIKKNNLCREVRVTTNGVLLSPELNTELVSSGIDLVRISVEALTEKSFFDICGVALNYEKFIKNVQDLYVKSRGTNTKISAKIIMADLFNESDKAKFFEIFSPITDHQFIEAEAGFWPQFAVNEKNSEDARNHTYSNLEDARNSICSFPLTNMMIFANGDIGVCCVDWRMDTVVGNVRQNTLKETWMYDFQKFRIAHLSGKRSTLRSCKECMMLSPDNIDADAAEILLKIQNEL